MYWSDWGNHPKIETAAMDGTLRETLVQDNIQWPTGERGGTGGASDVRREGHGRLMLGKLSLAVGRAGRGGGGCAAQRGFGVGFEPPSHGCACTRPGCGLPQ